MCSRSYDVRCALEVPGRIQTGHVSAALLQRRLRWSRWLSGRRGAGPALLGRSHGGIHRARKPHIDQPPSPSPGPRAPFRVHQLDRPGVGISSHRDEPSRSGPPPRGQEEHLSRVVPDALLTRILRASRGCELTLATGEVPLHCNRHDGSQRLACGDWRIRSALLLVQGGAKTQTRHARDTHPRPRSHVRPRKRSGAPSAVREHRPCNRTPIRGGCVLARDCARLYAHTRSHPRTWNANRDAQTWLGG